MGRRLWLPVTRRLLDYIGRGTAAGLLIAAITVANASGDAAQAFLDRAAALTVVGGAIGSVSFAALVLGETTEQAASTGTNAFAAFAHRHPWLVTLAGLSLADAMLLVATLEWHILPG